jgi:hypothetical protein
MSEWSSKVDPALVSAQDSSEQPIKCIITARGSPTHDQSQKKANEEAFADQTRLILNAGFVIVNGQVGRYNNQFVVTLATTTPVQSIQSVAQEDCVSSVRRPTIAHAL